jgi:putative solute:sodium symporter small subunit
MGFSDAAFRAIQVGSENILAMPKSRAPLPVSTPTPYWRRNLRLILLLLVVWAALTFVPTFFARRLSFDFIGWPFAFWMAAYGAPLAYLIIIGIYARVMNSADELAEEDADAARGDR